MKKLNYEEMKGFKAGSISGLGWALIAAGISFLSGIFDGYTRPYKCR